MKRCLISATLALVGSLLVVVFAANFHPAVADSLRPLFSALSTISCSSSSPCQTFSNSSLGAGVRGNSSAGNGVAGQTTSNSNSRSPAGVTGVDLSASARTNFGVSGVSTNGTGVSGKSTSGEGIFGSSASSIGVEGTTAFASSGKTFGQAGVEGLDASTDHGQKDIGVVGQSTNGIGVQAKSTNFVGANVVGGILATVSDEFPALSIFGITNASDLIDGCSPAVFPTANPCDSAHAVFRVDSIGNVTAVAGGLFTFSCVVVGPQSCNIGDVNIEGQYQVDGSCVTCAAATAVHPGRAVTRYVETQTLPTVEDFGEAQLTSGQAYVRLDPAFVNVLDQRSTYLVFITPEGPSHGLYVTQKTSRGFAVRENPGGQSTIAFSYRIVAKPFGESGHRLQAVTIPRLRASFAPQHSVLHS